MSAGGWRLKERARLSGGVVAHDRLGQGGGLIPAAGHFSPEDTPEAVAGALSLFFRGR